MYWNMFFFHTFAVYSSIISVQKQQQTSNIKLVLPILQSQFHLLCFRIQKAWNNKSHYDTDYKTFICSFVLLELRQHKRDNDPTIPKHVHSSKVQWRVKC